MNLTCFASFLWMLKHKNTNLFLHNLKYLYYFVVLWAEVQHWSHWA